MGGEHKTLRSLGPVAIVVAVTLALGSFAEARRRRPAVIVLYTGLGTTRAARLGGRVLEDRGLDRPRRHESFFHRLKRSYRLIESDEIPYAAVELSVLGKQHRLKADQEGLFSLELKGPLPVGEHWVKARLLSKRKSRTIAARLLVWPAVVAPSHPPKIAVISDIDDTVLQSKVSSKVKLVWKVMTSNAYLLKTYAGAPGLFRALGARGYPINFVSGSPINLYPRLRRFLSLKAFPHAPLFLKNVGTDKLFDQRGYKLRKIAEIVRLLPGYRLILIGDSGEQDPEIYAAVRKRWPKKVVASLIHRVTAESPKLARFAGHLVFDRYREAARFLRRKKLIAPLAPRREAKSP